MTIRHDESSTIRRCEKAKQEERERKTFLYNKVRSIGDTGIQINLNSRYLTCIEYFVLQNIRLNYAFDRNEQWCTNPVILEERSQEYISFYTRRETSHE